MQTVIGNHQTVITILPRHQEVIEEIGKEVAQKFNLGDTCEVSITFVDDSLMQELNKTFRGIEQPTDVLSFAFDEKTEEIKIIPLMESAPHLLGEIVISLERAKSQAEEYEHSFVRELAFLTVHGFLHLLGYDHQEEQDAQEMRSKEEEILLSLSSSLA